MKCLDIHSVETPSNHLAEISHALDGLPRQTIGIVPWDDYVCRPAVEFAIGHNNKEILVKFYVRENRVRALMQNSNEDVYKDSCVELFIAPELDGFYYNFEFNCIGTCLAQVGKNRDDRQFLAPEIINNIRRKASLGEKTFHERIGNYSWDLTIALPCMCLTEHTADSLVGKTGRANFYKCGDELSMPHYLSWSPIETPTPDFHQLEFFGKIRFV